MCCGVIIPSGIVTLVMGARPDPLESRFGAYTVERLIESAGWGDKIEVVTGVLTDACAEIQRDWESRSIGGRWARLV